MSRDNNPCNSFITKIKKIVSVIRIQSLLAEAEGFVRKAKPNGIAIVTKSIAFIFRLYLNLKYMSGALSNK